MTFQAIASNFRRVWQAVAPSGNEEDDDPSFSGCEMDSPSWGRSVSYDDICQARAILQSLKLPMELVLEILELASYEPWKQWTMGNTSGATATASAHYGESNEAAVLCLNASVLDPAFMKKFGDESPKIRDITWFIKSRDQGWTSEGTAGTFATSSWLEVSILTPDSNNMRTTALDMREMPQWRNSWPSLEEFHKDAATRGWKAVPCPTSIENDQEDSGGTVDYSWPLQMNRVATSSYEDYQVICSSATDRFEGNEGAGEGNGFLSNIKSGDQILVWARAQYPGWVCSVHSLQMIVTYSL